jgi:hypothetical protein
MSEVVDVGCEDFECVIKPSGHREKPKKANGAGREAYPKSPVHN